MKKRILKIKFVFLIILSLLPSIGVHYMFYLLGDNFSDVLEKIPVLSVYGILGITLTIAAFFLTYKLTWFILDKSYSLYKKWKFGDCYVNKI